MFDANYTEPQEQIHSRYNNVFDSKTKCWEVKSPIHCKPPRLINSTYCKALNQYLQVILLLIL